MYRYILLRYYLFFSFYDYNNFFTVSRPVVWRREGEKQRQQRGRIDIIVAVASLGGPVCGHYFRTGKLVLLAASSPCDDNYNTTLIIKRSLRAQQWPGSLPPSTSIYVCIHVSEPRTRMKPPALFSPISSEVKTFAGPPSENDETGPVNTPTHIVIHNILYTAQTRTFGLSGLQMSPPPWNPFGARTYRRSTQTSLHITQHTYTRQSVCTDRIDFPYRLERLKINLDKYNVWLIFLN